MSRNCVICELAGPRPAGRKQRLNWNLLHWAWSCAHMLRKAGDPA